MKLAWFGIVLSSVLLFALSCPAQRSDDDPTQEIPVTNQDLGPNLMAWSDMQTPEPVPQPEPHAAPRPEPKPETAPPQPAAPVQTSPATPAPAQDQKNQNQTQPAAQTFTGTISKEGDSFVLKVADTTSYKLDDQDKAKQFVGQRVQVLGILESSENLIRVEKIEPLS